MFFSCGVNSTQASARQLIVQEEAEEESQLKDPPSQSIQANRCLSPQSLLNKTHSSAESSDTSRCSSPCVRSISGVMGDHEDTQSTGIGGEIYIPPGDTGDRAGTIEIPRNSGGGDGERQSREPDSPGSRSHYGEFYWDTNGETNYHNTSSFDDDLLDFDPGRGSTAARLDRTQDDLNKFKKRIDSNVEQQKEYSDMMHSLQQKVSEYRKHIAELEGKMVGARKRYLDDGGMGLDPSIFVDTGASGGGFSTGATGGGIGDPYGGRSRVELWSPARRQNINLNIWGEGGAGGGGLYPIGGDTNANFDAKLDEERRRSDELRLQLDNAAAVNNQLANENESLRRQAQAISQDHQNKERGWNAKERNLSQYLSDEQQKMLDLWTELQRVRKQFNDLKDQTQRDLDNQRAEFNRVIRGIDGVATGGGSTFNHELTVIEAVKRMRGGGDGDLKAYLDELRGQRGYTGSSEGDAELHKELMQKYEESIERNIELESKGDESQRKIAELEAELRRAKEKLNDSQSALKKLHEMALDQENVRDGTVQIKRSRSMSPGKTPISPTEVLRATRNAFRNKDNELQQLERKLKIAENQAKEFIAKFETAEEARRRLDKQLADAKREIANQQKLVDENERNLRRFEDKLRNSESEKVAAEKARKFLEDELARLQEQYQKATSEDAKRLRDEGEEQMNHLEEDYKNRISELNRRIENLQRDNNKLKQELVPLKDKYRDLESEFNAMQRRLEERDAQIRFLDNLKSNTQKDLEDCRTKCDMLSSENERANSELENAIKKSHLFEQQLKEIKQQRDDFQKQKDELSRSLFEIKQRIEDERKARNEALKNGERSNDEVEKLKQALDEQDRQIILLRRHNDELDTTVKNNQAKIAQLENEIHSRNTEIQKLNDLNLRLQTEKQDVLNQKHKADADNDASKERIRKLQQEVEKLQNEIKALEAERDKALAGANQETQRANALAKELANNKQDLLDIKDKAAQLEKEVQELRDRLKNGGRRFGTNINIHGGGGSRPGSVYDPARSGGGSDGQRGGEGGDAASQTPGSPSQGGGYVDIPREGEDGRDGLDGGVGPRGRDGEPSIDDERYRGGVVDPYRDDELTEIRIRDINDKWKMEVERLENEKEALERKIQELRDELAQVGRGQDRQENDLAELQRKHQAEIDKLKGELAALHDKHLSDLDDEREQYNKSLENLKSIENELRDKINALERTLGDALTRENILEQDLKDRDDKMNQMHSQNQKYRDDLEDLRNEMDKEVQKWKTEAYTIRSEAKALETANAGLNAQLQAATDKADLLNKQNLDLTSKIRELNSQIRRLDEELSDVKSTLLQKDGELESALNRLRTLEDQYAILQSDSNKYRSDLEQTQRENDTLKNTNVNLESELSRLRNKLQQSEDSLKELRNNYSLIKSEKERLQNAFREKAKQVDHLSQLGQSAESRIQKMRDELNSTSEKLINSDNERTTLRNELNKMQQELKFGLEQMHRKTDEYESTLNDLANAHRAAEDGRLNALQELETKKYEINDLTSRLDNAEQRLLALQQEYIQADQERDILSDALRRFQASANRIININAFDPGFGVRGGAGGAARSAGYDPSSNTNIGIRFGGGGPGFRDPASVDIPPAAEEDLDSGLPRSVPFPAPADHIDPSALEATLQRLLNRIEQLESERNALRDELNRLKQKATDSSTTYNKKETHFKTVEDNLENIEDEKRALEAKLKAAKDLLHSQEENFKQRDEERRQMKSKMVAAELQARGKEAQLRHLNEQLKNLRTDLDNAHADIRLLRDHEEQWDTTRFQLESKNREGDAENQRLQLQIATFESERQNLQEKIKQLDSEMRLTEQKMADYKDDNDKLKRDLTKAETLESELRRQVDLSSKTSQDYLMIKDQLVAAQNELNQANLRRQTMENELLNLRSELREHKQRVQDVNSRVSDLQRQLQDANGEKNRLEDRLLNLEKQLTQQRSTEADLKQQLETAKNEKRQLQKDLEDLRRRLTQLETDKVKNLHLLENWKKEKAQLMKKIELLETDKRRTDTAIRETALQREAIEKSLNAMERENKELYKNCAQLQQQIAQLEMENGNRILELTNKQREEQERQLLRMRQEKGQIEKVIENRERTHRNRIQQLEDQLRILREQLDQERRRRRDFAERGLVNDIGRLGGNTLGIRGFGGNDDTTINVNLGRGGIHSAGGGLGGLHPRIGGFGNYSGVRSTFASNPLTPPLGASTPTHRQTYDPRPTSVMGRDPSVTGSIYGGRGSDAPSTRDPSIIEIPRAEEDIGAEVVIPREPQEISYGGPGSETSSMTGSRYDTLGRDRGI
ncbi:unnamed protein product, partial [Mesorhabditis belari]|uniref:Uncharacterized protein n=1 Tax=Mesorhabditis belari TaxID=2138241 RepID=A0AAF3ET70_9BILA